MTYGVQNRRIIRNKILEAYAEGAADIAKRNSSPGGYPGELKKLREQLELSQAEFAEAFGVAFSNIKNWEQPNRSKPSGVAALYLKLIERDPETIRQLVQQIKKDEALECID